MVRSSCSPLPLRCLVLAYPMLTPVSDIDWLPLTGKEGIEAFGVYFHRANAIGIDERFKFDADAIRACDPKAEARLETTYRLVLHEMVHQAQYQKSLPRPGSHGPSFVAEATRIAGNLGVPPPTEGTAHRWPELAGILTQHGI